MRVAVSITFFFVFILYWLTVKHQQELSTLEGQLGSCHARYEGYNLPVVPRPEDIEEALSRLGGRWKNLPRDSFGGNSRVNDIISDSSSSSSSGSSSSSSSSTSNRSNSTAAIQRGIPKYIWQTMKEVPRTLPQYARDMFNNNPGWFAGTMDDDDVNAFMQHVFAKTSILWAFRKINPKLGAMKADIWRYAVLYALGGVYIDADSSFKNKLDSYLKPDDGFVFATESNKYPGCYQEDFYLGSAQYNNEQFLATLPFTKYKLVQWMLIARPRHPVMLAALRNIVSIVKHLYLKKPVMLGSTTNRARLVCTTGPDLLTATMREVIWKHRNITAGGGSGDSGDGVSDSDMHYRYVGDDYADMKAVYKEEPRSRHGFNSKGHWSALVKSGAHLLSSYNTQ